MTTATAVRLGQNDTPLSAASPPGDAYPSGALELPKPHVAYVTLDDVPVGATFTDGFERLKPTNAKRPVVVKDVSWVGSTIAVDVLGWQVAGPDRKVGAIQVMPGYPPTVDQLGPLRPAVGTTVSDTRVGHELLVGIKVVNDDYTVREGIAVTTERNGDTFRDVLPATLVFCGSLDIDSCVARYEAETGAG